MKKIVLAFAILLSLILSASAFAQSLPPIVFEGVGTDIIETDFSAKDYPVVRFESACEGKYDGFELKSLLPDGTDENMVPYINCSIKGSFYFGTKGFEQIEFLEVDTPGTWKIEFLPTDALPTFDAPVIVQGSQSATFIVRNFNKVFSFDIFGEKAFWVRQFAEFPENTWDFEYIVSDTAPINGKKFISTEYEIFQVKAENDWTLSFRGADGSTATEAQIVNLDELDTNATTSDSANTNEIVEIKTENTEPDNSVCPNPNEPKKYDAGIDFVLGENEIQEIEPEPIIPDEEPIVEEPTVQIGENFPAFSFLTATENKATAPEAANIFVEFLAESLSHRGSMEITDWTYYFLNEEKTKEETLNEIFKFYLDLGWQVESMPMTYDLNIDNESLGQTYEVILSKGEELVWVIILHKDITPDYINEMIIDYKNDPGIGHVIITMGPKPLG